MIELNQLDRLISTADYYSLSSDQNEQTTRCIFQCLFLEKKQANKQDFHRTRMASFSICLVVYDI